MATSSLRHKQLLDQVLVKGHPLLAQVCAPVTLRHLTQSNTFRADCTRLCETLLAFRFTHGYGRAIAAPQIGINLRMIALNLTACANYESLYRHSLSQQPRANDRETTTLSPFCLPGDCLVLMNPQITYKSRETRTVWDDCLSLPDTMVRVRRHEKIGVQWMDHHGDTHIWQPDDLEFDLSELLQHEMDHLDGTLATDIVAEDDQHPSIISRREFEANKEFYQSYVDYII